MSIVHTSPNLRSNFLSNWLDTRERRKSLSEDSTSGLKVAIWGAGAKGATYLNLIDPNRELIEFAVDLTSEKQGKFIPGTGHKIVSYEALRNVDVVLLMNPNYHEENQKLLDDAGIKVLMIDVN